MKTPTKKQSADQQKNKLSEKIDMAKKLGIYFYSLAIIYYIIQITEKVSAKIPQISEINLSQVLGEQNIIDNILQMVTIAVMFYTKRKAT